MHLSAYFKIVLPSSQNQKLLSNYSDYLKKPLRQTQIYIPCFFHYHSSCHISILLPAELWNLFSITRSRWLQYIVVQVNYGIKIEMLQLKSLFLKNILWCYFNSMGWHYCFSKEKQSTVMPSLVGLYGDIASLKEIKETQMHSKNHKGPEKWVSW